METFDLENFPTSDSARKMLSYVSDGFYDSSYVGKWLFQAMGLEYDMVRQILEELPAQFFPESATWGLMYHEVKWGLPVRPNLSYEERRKIIYQKRDFRAPMTPYRMEQYLENVTGFEVHVADVCDPGAYGFAAPHPNVFKVYFKGDGKLPAHEAYDALDRLKQSHTVYTVNDRTEIQLDSSGLERFLLNRILIAVEIAFFGCFLMDGSWILDGSVTLGLKPAYRMITGLRCRMKLYLEEWAKNFSGRVLVKVANEERAEAKITHSAGIVSWDLSGSVGIVSRFGICTKENIGSVSATVKTDDYWFLDGEVCMDGFRRMDCVYEKEEIE